jgi:multicomponent Na+:H+ antiporter subunit E
MVHEPSTFGRKAAGLIVVALAATAVWLGLTGMDAGALWIGAPTVALTVAAAARAGLPAMLPRAVALPGFALLFLTELFRSAAALALRLARRDPGFRPGLVTHRMRLRGTGARAAFMNAVSLTPGSLSAALRGDRLTVHVLDGDTPQLRAELAVLEARVAELYGEGR